MYEDASPKVRLNGRESTVFNVKVGMLFIIVLDALSGEFREGLPNTY